MASKSKRIHHDPPVPFTKRADTEVAHAYTIYLPEFIGTGALGRLLNRDSRTVKKWILKKYLPERTVHIGRTKGWSKATILKWLKQHPEAIRR